MQAHHRAPCKSSISDATVQSRVEHRRIPFLEYCGRGREISSRERLMPDSTWGTMGLNFRFLGYGSPKAVAGRSWGREDAVQLDLVVDV